MKIKDNKQLFLINTKYYYYVLDWLYHKGIKNGINHYLIKRINYRPILINRYLNQHKWLKIYLLKDAIDKYNKEKLYNLINLITDDIILPKILNYCYNHLHGQLKEYEYAFSKNVGMCEFSSVRLRLINRSVDKIRLFSQY